MSTAVEPALRPAQKPPIELWQGAGRVAARKARFRGPAIAVATDRSIDRSIADRVQESSARFKAHLGTIVGDDYCYRSIATPSCISRDRIQQNDLLHQGSAHVGRLEVC